MKIAVAASLGYLIGSIPFAFVLSRRRGIDLRRVGSGNVGATNVLRTSGVSAAIVAMCLDTTKGMLAVAMARRFSGGTWGAVTAGLASMVGHSYPVWLGFRGGKGVATAAGVFAILAPSALCMAAAGFIVAALVSGYISVASLVGAITLAGVTLATGASDGTSAGALAAALLILHRHRSNISRLRTGTEHRVGLRL